MTRSKSVFTLILLETEVKPEAEEAADKSTLPPCDTGCTESKLGLLNNGQERDVLELLKVNCLFTTQSA